MTARDELRLEVFGQPAPQGSKRAFINRHTGRAHVIESSHDRVKSWRQAVLEACREAMTSREPFTAPVKVRMTFIMPRPKSHYRTGKNAHLLKDSAPLYPGGTPDLSKLCRATEDALTDAGAWTDDSLVVCYERLAKHYVNPSMPLPGAHITILEMNQ
jgi:Holliday junction resolvase RusA-like endonuclease